MLKPEERIQAVKNLFPDIPRYRIDQIYQGLFKPRISCWKALTTLPTQMREILSEKIPWNSYQGSEVICCQEKDVFKAVLILNDGNKIETVLMKNKRNSWTICISTQVGCPLKCSFCATGKMGFVRDLNSDETIDQLRFWQKFLANDIKSSEKITNLVIMGMGEPLLNYLNVRNAINIMLKYTQIGKNHITISTVGIISELNNLLTDPLWPGVRIAISLHSADYRTRKKLVPITYPEFFQDLEIWAKKYLKLNPHRSTYLTFECVIIAGINDTIYQARKLADYAKRIGRVKVNLIPYNKTGTEFRKPDKKNLILIRNFLNSHGITCTIRDSKGEEISAGCGQLGGGVS